MVMPLATAILQPVPHPETSVPSASVEDYLKAIYSLSRRGPRASTTALAERLGFAPSSVSTMVSRLGEARRAP